MAQKIKTNIKFYKGLDNVNDRLYGFVTKVNGSWKGCRVSVKKKKIVFVDQSIANDIIPNTLYNCVLIPMRESDGFIVKSATLMKFKGTIITSYENNDFVVCVKFGNKLIKYRPDSKIEKETDIQAIANLLRSRVDLENAQDVAEDFVSSACIIKRLFEQNVCG